VVQTAKIILQPTDKRIATFAIMLATVIQVLDTTIANVALPHMQGSLLASQDQISWVLTSYIVASALMTLPTGWLAGRYGAKLILLISVAGFTLSSVFCGLAMTLEQMIIARVLQGVFGAALVPLSQSTLLNINSLKDQAKAMALWGMGVMIGPILGPTLGGYLTEYYNWRWVFFINLPLGIISFMGLWWRLKESEKLERPFDKIGFLTLSVFIACLQLLLDRGEGEGWLDSPEILVYIGLGVGAIWMYVVHTLREKHPFLSPQMLLDRNLQMGLFFIFIVGVVLLATMALMPPYMQNIMGYSVLDVGLLLAPRGLGTLASMVLVRVLISRVDARWLMTIGLVLTVAALHMMSKFTVFVPSELILLSGMIQGFGLGFVFIPLSTVSYSTLEPQYRAEAAALFSLIRNLGSSIGVSVAFTLFLRNVQTQHAQLTELVTWSSLNLPAEMPMNISGEAITSLLPSLDSELTKQAVVISYLNDFEMLKWLVIFIIPLILLINKPPLQSSE
jgi:DHA2 family multidrug resistance protein